MKLSIHHFAFFPQFYGHYMVSYQSPKTGKVWVIVTDNMQLIDKTKNAERPTQKALTELRKLCKRP